ncbi:MAG: hypothetical protein CSB46_10465 [Micrococcales bacterium]|nr:MAG: hypothetical protein CSB46_10465 [Micrococcales bacterium]
MATVTDPRPTRRSTPVDPDVDLHDPVQRLELVTRPWLLPVVAAGGVMGASARHGIEVWWPPAGGGFPWATFVTNVAGCLLMGALMVVVVDGGPRHPLLRPFAGVGLLGGFTTMSTYAVGAEALQRSGHGLTAVGYLLATVLAAVPAVLAGDRLTRAIRRRFARPPGQGGAAQWIRDGTPHISGVLILPVALIGVGFAAPVVGLFTGAGAGAWWVAVGAVLGAPGRYLTDRAVQARHDTFMPWGTLSVNMIGSLLLGAVASQLASAPPGGLFGLPTDTAASVALLVGTGFCGSLTTWSTAGYEIVALARRGEGTYAVLYAVVTPLAVLGAAGVGFAIGAA